MEDVWRRRSFFLNSNLLVEFLLPQSLTKRCIFVLSVTFKGSPSSPRFINSLGPPSPTDYMHVDDTTPN